MNSEWVCLVDQGWTRTSARGTLDTTVLERQMESNEGPWHILLVEDDVKLARLVQEYLEAQGYQVTIEGRGDRAVERVAEERPDLVILDLLLPGLDGWAVCRQVRPWFAGPILMLTALDDEIDEVVGLELGADDYLTKPVRPRVLLARVRTLLRRLERPGRTSKPESTPIDLKWLVVDPLRRSVMVDGNVVTLTTAEFDLLWLLATHAGQVLSREQISQELRGIEYDGLDRSHDLRVSRLRKKLGDTGRTPQRIKSVRGLGYLLVPGT